MNNAKCGLITKISIHNIINEWNIINISSKCIGYYASLNKYGQLVKYGKKYFTPCVATALDLPYRHLQPNPKGLLHALHATVLILNDTALKGLTVYD